LSLSPNAHSLCFSLAPTEADIAAGNKEAAKVKTLFLLLDFATDNGLQKLTNSQGLDKDLTENFIGGAAGITSDKIKEGVLGKENKPSGKKINKKGEKLIGNIPRTKINKPSKKNTPLFK